MIQETTHQTIELSANYAKCLKEATYFGKTVVYNICNGKVSEVPWGTVDWAAAIVLTTFGALICLVILGFIFMMLNDIFNIV